MFKVLDILNTVRKFFPDAALFNGGKGEKIFFSHRGHKFFIHPDCERLHVKIRRGNDRVFSCVLLHAHFDSAKFITLLRIFAATSNMFTTEA